MLTLVARRATTTPALVGRATAAAAKPRMAGAARTMAAEAETAESM